MNKVNLLNLKFLGTSETIAAYLIESDDGPILFECGPHSVHEHLKQEIEKIGYDIKDIKHLFLTHIHFDHAGGAWALAKNGTKVYVHPQGYKHLVDPTRLYNSAKRIYQDKMEYLWGRMEGIDPDLLEALDDSVAINIGGVEIEVLHTPGHAVHHIAYKIDDIAIVGDVAGCRIEGGPVVPPCPPPDIDIELWIKSIDRLREHELDQIYLTHFGSISSVESHMQELKTILWDWANFMKPHFEKGTALSEVTPLFARYAKEQLIESGVTSPEILSKYENANPAWMSVAGLIRYWSKKVST